MVLTDLDNPVHEQDRCVPQQTSKGYTCLSTPFASPNSQHLQVPLERYFPEYTGGSDVNKGAKYILWRFMQANRARLSVYPQYVHFARLCATLNLRADSLTQATDTSNIRLVFAAVKETILQNALKDYGIL